MESCSASRTPVCPLTPRLKPLPARSQVFYEGSTCAHARPYPLVGRHFANQFMIFRPSNLPYTTDGISYS